MTPEQRKRASVDLTLTFFQSYSSKWRLIKILAIQKLIKKRHEFYQDIFKEMNEFDNKYIDGTIAEDIHNGLHHDGIAQCIQYIEDFFALLNATKNPNFFVQKITTYRAGDIIKNIKSYKPDRDKIIRDFFIPSGTTHKVGETRRNNSSAGFCILLR